MDTGMTLQLTVALICELSVSLLCLAYFFDMLYIVVCTTRHRQTSGQLVQELDVCTVYVAVFGITMIFDEGTHNNKEAFGFNQ